MRTVFLSFFLLIACSLTCEAQYYYGAPQQQVVVVQRRQPQYRSPGSDKGPVFSMNLGFGAGQNYTSFNISPQFGYAFNQYLTMGVGAGYNSINYYGRHQSYRTNYFGPNMYLRLTPARFFAFQVQPEVYHMWGNTNSRTVGTCLLGMGAVYPMGHGAFSAMLYYDVAQSYWSPYGNYPFLSLGYIFKF